MDYFYVFGGMFVGIIAFFKREMLIRKEDFKIIFGVSIALFFAGLILHSTEADADSFSGALLTPLVSLGLYRLCRRVFLKRFKREPTDTFFNWESGLASDRLFNIVYFGSSIWVELLAIGGMMKLAKAGW